MVDWRAKRKSNFENNDLSKTSSRGLQGSVLEIISSVWLIQIASPIFRPLKTLSFVIVLFPLYPILLVQPVQPADEGILNETIMHKRPKIYINESFNASTARCTAHIFKRLRTYLLCKISQFTCFKSFHKYLLANENLIKIPLPTCECLLNDALFCV